MHLWETNMISESPLAMVLLYEHMLWVEMLWGGCVLLYKTLWYAWLSNTTIDEAGSSGEPYGTVINYEFPECCVINAWVLSNINGGP